MDANSELADVMLAEYRCRSAGKDYRRYLERADRKPAAKIAKSLKRTLGATRKKRHPSLAYHWIRAGEIDIGFGYIVVEELVAIVDPRTRKVEIVFPRWAEQ